MVSSGPWQIDPQSSMLKSPRLASQTATGLLRSLPLAWTER